MNVDPSVLRAMNEINASRRQREAAVERAEAEKILAVKAAEAEAEAKELSGKGTARMRQTVLTWWYASERIFMPIREVRSGVVRVKKVRPVRWCRRSRRASRDPSRACANR
eukprot:1511911-Rhodomonas_salina.1